jgi:Transposase DDE domain
MTMKLSKNLQGLLFGDKGYLSARTTKDLLKKGLRLITKVRQNMKPKPISETNKFLLHKRGIVETIFGNFKDFKHLVHTKYRSVINYFTNILSALTAYMLNPNKPSICLDKIEAV